MPRFPSGIYHLANAGAVSRNQFAREILSRALKLGFQTLLKSPQDIAEIPSGDYPCPATRPLNSRLALGKFDKTFSISPPPWEAGLDECFALLRGQEFA
jgi:dTDP-4-dehydrorhamnose reductase